MLFVNLLICNYIRSSELKFSEAKPESTIASGKTSQSFQKMSDENDLQRMTKLSGWVCRLLMPHRNRELEIQS